jgi:hypothetical protein
MSLAQKVRQMKSTRAVLLAALGLAVLSNSAQSTPDCGVPGTLRLKRADGQGYANGTTRVFKDGSVVVRARLAVNPDGGPSSYTAGDHGFTYLVNGMDRWTGFTRQSCQRDPSCRSDFLNKTEAQQFAPGTPAFCVYAFEVTPYKEGGALTPCGGGRSVIGNGQGKPKLGPLIESITGHTVQTYLSTTSLKHLVGGKPVYLNSETLPIAVTPDPKLLGNVVWIGGKGYQPTLALLGDVGPAFGEGSIALHQLLRTGSVNPQRPGPINIDKRCGPEERSLQEPFQSRPDGGLKDACKAGRSPSTSSDIRAYSGITDSLSYVVLGQASLPRKKSVIQTEITTAALVEAAKAYSSDEIQRMLSCLPD